MPSSVARDVPILISILIAIMGSAPLVAILCGILFHSRPRVMNWVTPVISLISLVASAVVADYVINNAEPIYQLNGSVYLDALSMYFVLLVNLVAFFASFSVSSFLKFDAQHNAHHDPIRFHSLFNLFHLTMLLVPMVNNLVILWIMVELTTVFSTILVSYRRDRMSLEAAWKFIMITTTGIIFALLGTLFLAKSIGSISSGQDPMNWSVLVQIANGHTLDPNYVHLSFLFVLLGYGTKAGLAPMHTWLPDGHGQAPAPVSALLSGVMLKSALYAILRFYTITNLSLGDNQFTSRLLLFSGLLSLVLATPFILKRNRFKRVLAYHSLEHMGIITFGIGIGGQVALFGALLHALNHALTKALMFLMYGSIQYEYQDRCGSEYADGEGGRGIQGVLQAMPISGTILAFGGLALVGSPPFNIFMSEFIILWAAISQAKNNLVDWTAIVLFFGTVTLIFGGLVGHLSRLLLGAAPFAPVEPRERWIGRLAPFIALILIIFIFGLLTPGWPVNFPAILVKSAEIVSQSASNPSAVRFP